jgi:hypothetical protein
MPSLLTNIQNYFDASYGGRYVAHLLSEFALHHPDILTSIFPSLKENLKGKSGPYKLTTEWKFDGVKGQRKFADIAILDSNSNPLFIVEIKYDDHNNKKNPAQAQDYASLQKEFDCGIAYLSKNTLPDELRSKIEANNFEFVSFGVAHSRLLNSRSFNTASHQMLISFFRDSTSHYQTIDQKSATNLLHRLFNGRDGLKVAVKDNELVMADCLKTMFENMRSISNLVTEKLGKNRIATIDFWLSPSLNVKRLQKALEVQEFGETIDISDKVKQGGTLYVYARHTITELGDISEFQYLHFEYGYAYEVSPPLAGKVKLKKEFFVQIWGRTNASKADAESINFLKRFSVERQIKNAEDFSKKIIQNTQSLAIDESKSVTNKNVIKAMRKFQEVLCG